MPGDVWYACYVHERPRQGDNRDVANKIHTNSVPTMHTVAARAQVSAMTVSRVLHGAPGVHPQTRDRVLAAVEELGYRRNEVARCLRIGRTTGLVGLVVTDLADPICAQLALGAEAEIAGRGMRLLVGNSAGDQDQERSLVDDFASRQVAGMIVVPSGGTPGQVGHHGHLGPAALAGTPVVVVARPAPGAALDTVLIDDAGGAHAATARLIAAGHTRIGFLGLDDSWNTAERFRGFIAAHAEAGVTHDPRHVHHDEPDTAAREKAAHVLLTVHNPPTALFCANTLNTIGAVRAISGLLSSGDPRVAEAVPVIAGFDDTGLADALGLPFTLVSYDARAMGREAVRLLLARLDHDRDLPSPPAQQTILPTRVVEHGTAAQRRESGASAQRPGTSSAQRAQHR